MSVGSQIRRAREAAGVTLPELADRTKIRASVLEAMERDDFSAAGGDIYVRMQLRTIAQVIGVPAEQFGQGEVEDTRSDPTAIAPRRRERDPDEDGPASRGLASLGGIDRLLRRRRGANWTAAMLVALVAAIAVIVAIVLLGKDRGAASADDLMSVSQLPVSVSAGVTPAPAASLTATDDTMADVSGVTVTLEGVGVRSWVSVTAASTEVLFDGLVLMGEKKTFRDPTKVRVTIGNAGAIALTVNGSALGPAGAEGDVRSLEFTPGQPTASLR